MTNTGGTPAGWYYAPGDPEGTQRYWDGAQWIGDPQAVQQAAPTPAPQPDPTPAPQPDPAYDAEQTVAYQAPQQQQPTPPSSGYADPGASSAPPNYGAAPDYGSAPGAQPGYQQPPTYGAPGAQPGYQQPPAYGGAPAGYQSFATPGAPGVPAEFGPRAIAFLIDYAPIFVWYVVTLVASAVSDVLGLLVNLVGGLAILGYSIWNFYIVQGKTGQTIGKKQQGIKLVSDATGQPVGGGMAFVRYLCSGAFIFACCVGYVVNLLSPLWNSDKKTYSDKIMKMSVVTA